jgi:hypothetical protein
LATVTEIDRVVAALSIVPPVTVTPVGTPVAAIVTGPVKPPPRTIVAVKVAEVPALTVADVGLIDNVTVGVGAATVNA